MSEQFQNDWEQALEGIKKYKKQIGFFILFVIAFLALNTFFYTVQPDEEAVILRLGKYVETTGPGLHFKLPLGVDQVRKVRTQVIHQEEFGFRSQDVSRQRTTYSTSNFVDESIMLTGDLNVADVEWVVQYQIAEPYKFLFKTSTPVRNVRDVSESIMRRVVGDRAVTDVLTVGRVGISGDAKLLMQEVLNRYDVGIRIVSVKLQDVNPPDSVKSSFNEVNEAKQEQEKAVNEAEKEYNRVIPEAKGKADQRISEAEGYSTELINRAEGDVSKFDAVFTEYRKAPRITKRRIYLETMEEIFGDMKDLTIVDPQVKGVLPVYQQGKGD